MGIRIPRSSWHAPLQLIDSWLPQQPVRPANRTLSLVAQRFARAGWLWSGSTPAERGVQPGACLPVPPQAPPEHGRREPLRKLRTSPCAAPVDTRVVLSGRLSDVCAELERLASLERGAASARH